MPHRKIGGMQLSSRKDEKEYDSAKWMKDLILKGCRENLRILIFRTSVLYSASQVSTAHR
ncbi:hypothetical protein [Reichenbachiella agariperforans]|uniref:hypothetical protein n=1 Tax=Reichenbachiella agariperforans TaxID=156994 RepID=UPI001114A256|nr:hypothetical protein [Reichenbachiella agariperforans]